MQTPLPQLMIASTFEAYCHSLAYGTAGVPHPLRRALIVHTCGMAVTTVCRAWQLRAYRRWQATEDEKRACNVKTAAVDMQEKTALRAQSFIP